MPRVERTVEISATPETCWSILIDPSYIPKLYPDALRVEMDPPGTTIVGQKFHAIGRVARRKVEFFGEAVEVETNKKLTSRQRPGGLFKSFTATTTLSPTKKGTKVTRVFDYELSMGYLGKVLRKLVVDRVVRKNANVSLTNLKEIAELKEMPKTP